MKAKHIIARSTRSERWKGRADWKRLRALGDREIRQALRADPDAAPEAALEWFRRARIVLPQPKQAVSIRLDGEVLDWFKRRGRGYQTRINAVLRAYVNSQR